MIKKHLYEKGFTANVIQNFDRRVLKPAIMTSFYNVTPYTTNKYIEEKLGCPDVDGKELYKISEEVCNFLRTDYVKNILNINSLSDIYANMEILKEIDIKYYKSITSEERIRVIIENKTLSHSYEIKTKNIYFLCYMADEGRVLEKKYIIDKDKTKIAAIANIAHHLDALIVKELCSMQNIYPIHDMFMTNLKNKHKIYDKLNTFYNGTKGYGLFILK